MSDRRAQSVRSGSGCSQGVAWFGLLIFVAAASGWSLLCVNCAFTGFGWSKPEGFEFVFLLVIGIVPLLLALGGLVVLWKMQGPPFSDSREKK